MISSVHAQSSKDILRYITEPVFVVNAGVDDASSTSIQEFNSSVLENGLEKITITDVSNDQSFTCKLCGCQFQLHEEQRDHFRSEWHRRNLVRKMQGSVALSEFDFENLSDSDHSDNSTDSSSEDSDSEAVNDFSDTVNTETDRFLLTVERDLKVPRQYYFKFNGSIYSIASSLLEESPRKLKTRTTADILSTLHTLSSENSTAVFMLCSGRFAGAVFNGNDVIIHKTIQRYTSRAKQGGSQLAKDQAQHQHMPKSAGAQLRRYNEAALIQDIRSVITEWKPYLKSVNLIFLRCSAIHKNIFADLNEKCTRTIPFITHRPTFEEVQRVHRKLSLLVCHGDFSSFMQKLDDFKNQLPVSKNVGKDIKSKSHKNKSKSRRKTDKPVQEAVVQHAVIPEATTDQHNSTSNELVLPAELPPEAKVQIYTAFKSGHVESLKMCIDCLVVNHDRDLVMTYLSGPVNARGSNILHLAAEQALPEIVKYLLEFGVDPSLKTGTKPATKVAYQLSDKATKRVFSEFRAENPERWQWNLAQIPELLDPEVELAKQQRQAERKRVAKKSKMDRTKDQREAKKADEAERREQDRFLALSDREKRALAAERRIVGASPSATTDVDPPAKPVLSRCFSCAVDITGKTPFEYSKFVFCSPGCVTRHRRKVAI